MDINKDIEKKKKTILAADLELKFKIVLVGDSTVGKTSLFWRYIEDYFEDEAMQESTVTMVDFRMKNQIIDDDLVKLYIWDTAGQERYRSIISTYFKGAHAVIGIFDVTNLQSFISIQNHWITQCKDKTQGAIFYLVGNKKDLKEEENQIKVDNKFMVSKTDIDRFCSTHNVKYIEVSAKTGENIEDLFIELAIDIKKQFFKNQKPKQDSNKKPDLKQIDEIETKQSFSLEPQPKNRHNSVDNNIQGKNKSKKGGCC